jgi:rare lipoprotein A
MGGASTAYGGSSPEGQELVFSSFRSAGASWYGPGLYGRKTACGQILQATTIGVAHRNLPCGTMVKFVYDGSAVIAPVIDRGPYVKGRAWDLTAATSEALGFEGVGLVRYAVAVSYARVGS